jgi:nucleoside-diphosphate-sugar epimerase
VAPF